MTYSVLIIVNRDDRIAIGKETLDKQGTHTTGGTCDHHDSIGVHDGFPDVE